MGDRTVDVISVSTIEDLTKLYIDGVFGRDNWIVLGGGSNTIFVTEAIEKVIQLNLKSISTNGTRITSQAGVIWDDLVQYTVMHGMWGIENLALIPGTVGAAPIQNIGAYGTELANTLISVTYFDTHNGKLVTITSNQCKLGYRDSIFKHELKGRAIIIECCLELSNIPIPRLDYHGVQDALHNQEPTLDAIYNAICSIRRTKLADPKVTPNCGSFFKNPVISTDLAEQLRQEYPSIPLYSFQDNYKTSAAWCIDQLDLKGYKLGGVQVLYSQPLVLTNTGNASTDDLISMIQHIQRSVFAKYGISLESEVNLV
jgi:UDP-N-acetylmuramate dehydrogenase